MFEFKDDEKNYAVGLIGRKWLRITDETILCDGQALSFIRTMNPGRDFFCIITDENISLPHWVSLKNIITSQRMER